MHMTREGIRFVFNVVLQPVVISMGIVGNLGILLLLCACGGSGTSLSSPSTRKGLGSGSSGQRAAQGDGASRRRSPTSSPIMYHYMRALAVTDLAYLTFAAQNCYFAAREVSSDFGPEMRTYIYRFMMPTWNAFKSVSDAIVICMTLNRYSSISAILDFALTVSSPETRATATTSASQAASLRRNFDPATTLYTLVRIVGAYIMCFSLHLPFFFEGEDNCSVYRAMTFHDHGYYNVSSGSGSSSLASLKAATTDHQSLLSRCNVDEDLWIMYLSIYALLVKVMPIVVSFSLNVAIAMKLRTLWRCRNNLRSRLQCRPLQSCEVSVQNSSENPYNLGGPAASSAGSGSGEAGRRGEEGQTELSKVNQLCPATLLPQPAQNQRLRKLSVVQWRPSLRDAFRMRRVAHEHMMAKLTLIVATSFVIFTLPANIVYLQFVFYPKSQQMPDYFLMEVSITNFLEAVNYSFNFYLYCVVNGDIRRAVLCRLKRLFPCFFCKANPSS